MSGVGGSPSSRPGSWWRPAATPGTVMLALAALAVTVAGTLAVRSWATAGGPSSGPSDGDYISANRLVADPIVRPGGAASTGSWVSHCGRNENGHRNADNVLSLHGQPGAAMHLHDYVGNVATNAWTTDAALEAAATTCAGGDRSTYYWPVLRVIGAGSGPASTPVAGNTGRILPPESVLVAFRGNPTSHVLPMPALLRGVTGNARALTARGENTEHVQWGCSGRPGYSTKRYPLCPPGQRVLRTFDFPSCWDGRQTDSPTHRTHLVFPNATGACPAQTFPVPQLHIVVAYTVPPGLRFAIDAMPAERRSPLADHCDFIEVMPITLMNRVVDCVNSGRTC